MPEPITLALGAFALAKKAIELGKDANEISRCLGKAWSAIDDVKAQAANAKKSNDSNALEKFIALKQAEDLEESIRNIVISQRGEAGWRQLKQLRQQEKQQKIKGRYQATRRKNQIVNAIGIICAMLITGVGAYFMIIFAMRYQ
tara:strand:- start:5185 stop:5616 length:432 start_codon:yes stop_codon:yes gene_type:complete